MKISRDFLQELRTRMPVSRVVGRRVRLKKRGVEYVGLCPFHDDKNPSLTVNDRKGFYHCFSCGAHGDIVRFLMESENLGFVEAVGAVADELGMKLRAETPAEKRRAEKRQSLLELTEKACNWFAENLAKDEKTLAYLKRRGINERTIETFRLGFAPADQRRFFELFAGVAAEDLTKAGLASVGEDGKLFAYFRSRLIFPIFDRKGRVIAFGGRALAEDVAAKYLNSPRSEIFDKSAALYAPPLVSATAGSPVFVLEGYMDVLTAAQAGLRAVAPLGTAMSVEQLHMAWRLKGIPNVCFDGDAAGIRAALRLAERALPHLGPERSLSFITLPAGDDPDSYIRENGAEKFLALKPIPMDEFIFTALEREAPRGFATPEKRLALRRECHRLAALVSDQQLAAEYRRAFDDKFFKNATFAKRGEKPSPATSVAPSIAPWQPKELAWIRVLAFSLLNHPSLIEEYAEAIITKVKGRGKGFELLRHICDSPAASRRDSGALKTYLTDKGFDLEKSVKGHISTHDPFDYSVDADRREVAGGIKALLKGLEMREIIREAESAGDPNDKQALSIIRAAASNLENFEENFGHGFEQRGDD